MINDTTIFLIGPALGFLTFVASTVTMEGVLYRPNSEGQQEFTFEIFKDYLSAPFEVGTPKFDTLWGNLRGLTFKDRIKLLQVNWVAMVGAGITLSTLIILLKRHFF